MRFEAEHPVDSKNKRMLKNATFLDREDNVESTWQGWWIFHLYEWTKWDSGETKQEWRPVEGPLNFCPYCGEELK